MKKNILFVILFCTLFIFSNSTAQFQIGPGVGYTMMYNDDITKDISEGGPGLSGGIRYGAKARFLFPVLPINLVGHVFYTPLNSEGSYIDGNQTISVETSGSLLNAGFGAELTLFPAVVKPYLALDFLYNKFGETTLKGTVNGVTEENKVDGVNRTGIGIGIGARITVLPIIDLEASLKYNMLNMFGKEDNEDSINSLNFTFLVMF